ncbi:thioredoxin family protein [Stieleria sp. JC731]|uniref:thioredoxin family protein n=1 Tax=Pirellulaceae TaxID=2691357 RepID=UPI001E33D0B1|nr:thioredoxin family protein [Stieleria sp. JC731]MCC9601785.1 thioredoxin family protein [Stieleria sp. JC731]
MKHLLLLLSVVGTLVFVGLAIDFDESGSDSADGVAASGPDAMVASHQSSGFDMMGNGTGGKLVLMKFGAPWCPPCRMVDKELLELKKAKLPVEVRKINVDNHQALADQYQISSIPRLILTEDGEVIGDLTGYKSADELEAWIRDNASEKALAASADPRPATVYANPFIK